MSRQTPDQIHEIERGALSIAFLNGTEILTKHGLKARHFSDENGAIWRVLDVASKSSPAGSPEPLHVSQLLAEGEAAGLCAGASGAAFADLLQGTGDPSNALWYSDQIQAGWRARQRLRLSADLFKIEKGEADGDAGEIIRQLTELSREPTAKPDALSLLDSRRVSLAKPFLVPVPALLLQGQSIATAGNLCAISGQAKAGKSAAVASMVASLISPSGEGDFLGFSSPPSDGKIVLVFDTEQSPHDAWSLQNRILKRAGLSAQPDSLEHFYLLDLSPAERLAAVLAGTRRAAARGSVLAVVVDGVADLLEDVNDAAASNAVIGDLIALAVEIAAPVVVVVHENPDPTGKGSKGRGHLGSSLERKSESNLRIQKGADGVSVIFSEKCRQASIPMAKGSRFTWCDDAQMHVSTTAATDERKERAKEIEQFDLDQFFRSSGSAGGLPHAELINTIAEVCALKPGGARKRFDRLRVSGSIKQTAEGRWIRCL